MLKSSVKEKGLLLDLLIKTFPQYNRTKLKQLLKYGAILVNGKVQHAFNFSLNTGDRLEILSQEVSKREERKRELPFPILYEDDSLILIDKPAGLLTMGTDEDKIHTAYFMLTEYVRNDSKTKKGRIFIVHRLDREASGLVLFAKQESIKNTLQKEWDKVQKKYFALVEGKVIKKSDLIESYLVEDKFKRVFSTHERTRDAKHAKTRYEILKTSDLYSLLDVTLITGRKNQIRVHLSDIGHPIVGDKKYGAQTDPIGRLGLHAYYLSFRHPKTQELKTFKTAVPDSFA